MDRCLNHVETMKIVNSNQMNHRLNRCPSSFFHGLTWFDTIKMLVENCPAEPPLAARPASQ